MIAFAYEGLELVKKMVAYHINVILTRILTNSVFFLTFLSFDCT